MVVAEAVGVAVEVEHDGAVQEAVEHGGGDGGVAEDVAPGTWKWHKFLWLDRACWLGVCGLREGPRSSRL